MWIVADVLGGVDRSDRGDPLLGEGQPLLAGLRLEDRLQLPLEFDVALGVVGVLGAWVRLERSMRSTPWQKFFQKACSLAMNSTWPSLASYI